MGKALPYGTVEISCYTAGGDFRPNCEEVVRKSPINSETLSQK
jgi:hypothetical protein